MRLSIIAGTVAVLALSAGPGFAHHSPGHNQGGGPPATPPGFATETQEFQETAVYMGMSNKTPPNERAAASQGTRTEVTTYYVDVTGPKGQVDNYIDGDKDACVQCTFSDPYGHESEVTDYPGANR